jgi:predicted P-loop ATPase
MSGDVRDAHFPSKSPDDRLAALGHAARISDMVAAAASQPSAEKPNQEVSTSTGVPPRNTAARRRSPSAPVSDWLAGAQVDHRGDPVSNIANAMLALRRVPVLARAFRFDEMSRQAILASELPCAEERDDEPDILPRAVRDTDATQLQEWFQWQGLKSIPRETVHSAIDLRARENAFHPVKDYVNSLKWDGVNRLDTWLCKYAGSELTPYAKGIGQMFFRAMVARIFEPGCKADYMLILEGPQGSRKSTVCAIIGGPWFSDSLPDVTLGKDVSQHLRGKWLIEIAEMSAMSRAEDAALKAFVTRPVERYRPSYGRREVEEPRQCVFIGTTNKTTYLRDETGGRRFWPIKVGKIDTDGLLRDRDQLFAEAVAQYLDGGRWWPDGEFERIHIACEQESRFDGDPWEEVVLEYLEKAEKDIRQDRRPEWCDKRGVTTSEIARFAVGMQTERIGTADARRISSILTRAGWTIGKRTAVSRPYVPPIMTHDAL